MKMKKFFIVTVFAFSFLPSVSYAAGKILDIQEVTSPGGIKAWLVEDHHVPVIAMSFGFEGAGAVNDPADKQGLARMLSNTMDEGAGDLDSQSFQKELTDLSISLRFGSDRDDFNGTLKTTVLNKKRAFELLSLALNKPRFDEEPVGRMRAANQSRIRSSMSEPDWMVARLINARAFEGHTYAQNSGGTLSSLDKIGSGDLKNFHDHFLGRNNLVISVAGDISKEELGKVLDEVFGTLPQVTLPPAPAGAQLQHAGEIALYKQDIPQTLIEVLQPGIDKHDPDYQTAQIMNFILGSSGFGSRLTQEIREKRGLTYGIYSSFLDMRHFVGLSVSTSTENKNTAEILTLVKAEWEKMKNTPVSEQELQDAKNFLIGSLPLSLTSTSGIAGLMLGLQLDDRPIDYLDQREDAIRKTTAADIQRVAQKILAINKMTTILVGAPEGIDHVTVIEKIPNVE